MKAPEKDPQMSSEMGSVLMESLLEFNNDILDFLRFSFGPLGLSKDFKALFDKKNFLLTKHAKPVVDGDDNDVAIRRQGRTVVQVAADTQKHHFQYYRNRNDNQHTKGFTKRQ